MTNKVVFVFLFIGILSSVFAGKGADKKDTKGLFNLIQGDYTVDQVLQLLKNIKITEQEDLESLTNGWADSQTVLLAAIQNAQTALQDKVDYCDDIEEILNTNIQERDRVLGWIQAARDNIQQNLATIQGQEELRCKANLLFNNKVRENNQAIKFLIFLRTRITDPAFRDYLASNSNVLLELSKGVKSADQNVLGLLAKAHLMSQIQLKSKQNDAPYEGLPRDELEATYDAKPRTDEEIGTGHIDNNEGPITRTEYDQVIRDLDLFISQLVDLINTLINELEDSNRSLQEAEGEANYNFGIFIEQIELENQVLNRHINDWSAFVEQLNEIIENNQNAHDECLGQTQTYQAIFDAARDNYETQRSSFENRKTSQENTISMLDRVIQLYETKVVNTSNTYKERVEDYVEDDQGVFDKTDYERRVSSEDIDHYQEQTN